MQHVGFPIVKPRFPRLGGSIWELNIDTKRRQEDFGGPWRTERRAERQQEGENEAQQEEKHSPEALPDIDPASIGLRPPFAGSNICRRRGPLKLLSKLRS